MWCHPAHSLVCPLVYPLHYPVALYEVHVMSSSQLIFFPSSVQHCASTNVNLLQSFTLAVTFCWTRKRIHFPRTFFTSMFYIKCFYQDGCLELYRHSHRIVRDKIITNSPIWLADVFSIYMYCTIKQWVVSQSFVKKKNNHISLMNQFCKKEK